MNCLHQANKMKSNSTSHRSFPLNLIKILQASVVVANYNLLRTSMSSFSPILTRCLFGYCCVQHEWNVRKPQALVGRNWNFNEMSNDVIYETCQPEMMARAITDNERKKKADKDHYRNEIKLILKWMVFGHEMWRLSGGWRRLRKHFSWNPANPPSSSSSAH